MSQTRGARIELTLPKGVIGIGTAVYLSHEDYPTAETFLYVPQFQMEPGDSRETGYLDSITNRLKTFFPSSGCGIIIEDGKVVYTDSGLKELIGKEIELFETQGQTYTFIIYEGSAKDFSEKNKFKLQQIAEAVGTLFAPSAAFLNM